MTTSESEHAERNREQIAREFLNRIDRGEDISDLFADDAQVWAPLPAPEDKPAIAEGRDEFMQIFATFGEILERSNHHDDEFNTIVDGNQVVIEGTSGGTLASGVEYSDVRFVDIFEIEDDKIQRLHIYVDPEYSKY